MPLRGTRIWGLTSCWDPKVDCQLTHSVSQSQAPWCMDGGQAKVEVASSSADMAEASSSAIPRHHAHLPRSLCLLARCSALCPSPLAPTLAPSQRRCCTAYSRTRLLARSLARSLAGSHARTAHIHLLYTYMCSCSCSCSCCSQHPAG
mmetsp:Transcript_37264/g.74474  ORF Transcript_37264/g.74474 Transcript_37264/m.74474 type:complete len:148 (-) Transcript_37264:273-716(-)